MAESSVNVNQIGDSTSSNNLHGGTQIIVGNPRFGGRLSSESNWKSQFDTTDYCAYQVKVEVPFDGTCHWIDGVGEYQEWLRGTKSFLCVVGNPGTGKTVLARHIRDTIERHIQSEEPEESTKLIWYFCSSTLVDTRDQAAQQPAAISILRSLIHQYLIHASDSASAAQCIRKKYDQSSNGLLDSYAQLAELFGKVIENPGGENWYCIIDGFDSIRDVSDRGVLLNTIAPNSSIYGDRDCRKRVKLLLTTQPCQDIASMVRTVGYDNIVCFSDAEGNAANSLDIERFVKAQSSGFGGYSLEDSEKWQANLIREAAGNFRWIAAVLPVLAVTPLQRRQKKMETVSSDSMRAMIETIFERLNASDERKRGERECLLELIVTARRPLKLSELVAATKLAGRPFSKLGFAFFTKTVLCDHIQLCEPAVRLQGTEIHLFHFSLESAVKSRPHWNHAYTRDLHHRMASCCLAYLVFSTYDQNPLQGSFRQDCAQEQGRLMEKFPFLDYACFAWPYHLQNAHDSGSRELWKFVQSNSSENTRELMVQLDQFRFGEEYVRGQSWLHMLIRHNLTALVDYLLRAPQRASTPLNINARDEKGRTPIWLAVAYGREDMVRFLLATKSVDCNTSDNEKGLSPVMLAAARNLDEIVRQFVNVNFTYIDWDQGDSQGRTALWLAASHGHGEVVRSILEKVTDQVKLEVKCLEQTALVIAARKGHDSVVATLLACGADVESEDDMEKRTALSWAAGNGHSKAVTYLIERGSANIDHKDAKAGHTPLEWAAAGGFDEIGKLIIKTHCERHADRWTCELTEMLLHATKTGQIHLFRILFNYPDVSPEMRRKSLFSAAEEGYLEIVEQILGHQSLSVSVNSRDEEDDRKTLLMRVAEKGRSQILSLLLKQEGIDLDATDSQNRKVDDWAVGRPEIVALLRDKRKKVASRTSMRIPLSCLAH
ncbi:hypothetical protein LTR84_003669 [Exophiala bonariae]|uniref:Nephrocystin 3-like N-terminal domain-containing protein n=1 Tax=Exophiala bonariae TaxID=1690606 RepID=A0AAV9N811_9EURO|nr:hypothetical protein LTR84_003669 [Exophiala bonariae]